MKNEVILPDLHTVTDSALRQAFVDLGEKGGEIYAWAGLARIEKHLRYGDPIVFVVVDTKEVFVFEYICSVYDKNSEFSKTIAKWSGKGFERSVFLGNRRMSSISDDRIESVLRLVGSQYNSGSGFAGYKHDLVLNGSTVQELFNLLDFI